MARPPRSLAEKLKAHNPKQRAQPQGSAGYPPSAISGIGGDGGDNMKGGAMKTTTPPMKSRIGQQQVAPFISSAGAHRGK